jgi:hypothetical protein
VFIARSFLIERVLAPAAGIDARLMPTSRRKRVPGQQETPALAGAS